MALNNKKIPVWLDCDPGHDDAFAILFAAHHPSIELMGISTVHGNASVENTSLNACRILTAIGRSDVAVYMGEAKGVEREAVHAADIHGESGLDGTELLPEPAVLPNRTIHAIDAMARTLLATPKRTSWLVATGALTNVAMALKKYPDLVQHVKGLSIMGGAVGDGFTDAPLGKVGHAERFGNWTPYAEFNMVVDPESARSIFKNFELSAKITMIPLDLTHQVLATKDVQDLLLYGKSRDKSKIPSKLRTMLVELLLFFAKTYAEVFELKDGPPLHDPLAVAAILDNDGGFRHAIPFWDFDKYNPFPGLERGEIKGPEDLRIERFEVWVVADGTHEEALAGKAETGRTLVHLLEKGEAGVRIPRHLDVKNFWIVLEECIERADAKNAQILGGDKAVATRADK